MARQKKQAATPETEDRFAGVEIEGAAGYPHNHRLRAEAMVEDGLDTDPDGLISDELIADTRARLEAEANAPEPEPTGDEPNDDGETGEESSDGDKIEQPTGDATE